MSGPGDATLFPYVGCKGVARFHCPADIAEHARDWGANCGPVALAALLELELPDVFALMDGGFPGFTNLTMMRSWLKRAGFMALDPSEVGPKAIMRGVSKWPEHGLAFLQVLGPWMNGKPKEQYKYTHWIAVSGCSGYVYDVNAEEWQGARAWELRTVPGLLNAHSCSSGWEVRQVLEVRKFESSDRGKGLFDV